MIKRIGYLLLFWTLSPLVSGCGELVVYYTGPVVPVEEPLNEGLMAEVPIGFKHLTSTFPEGITVLQSESESVLRFVFSRPLDEDLTLRWSILEPAIAYLFEEKSGVIVVPRGAQQGNFSLRPRAGNHFYVSYNVKIHFDRLHETKPDTSMVVSISEAINILLYDDRGGTVTPPLSGFQLDLSFGEGGLFTAPITNGRTNTYGVALAMDSRERLVVGGFAPHIANGWNSDAVVWRLNSNGLLDADFGTFGYFFFNPTAYNRVSGVYLRPDDSVDAMGFSDSGRDTPTHWRLSPMGIYVGHTQRTFGVEIQVRGSAQNQQGDLFTCGSQSSNYLALAKFKQSGVVDSTFGSSGRVTFNLVPNSRAHACATDSNGKLIVVGDAKPGGESGTSLDILVLRFNVNGSLDTSFNSGLGYLTRDASGGLAATNESGAGVLIGPNNEIYVVGSASDGTRTGLALWKFASSGSLDSQFGVNGIVTDFTSSTITSGASGASLSWDRNGDLLVAGRVAHISGSYTDMAVWNFSRSTGNILPSPSGPYLGLLRWTNPDLKHSWASAVRVDDYGRLLVVGGADDENGNNRMKVWRFIP